MYFIDRLIRFYSSSKKVKIVDIRHGFGGHVRLELKVESFKYRPGQYCFINVPIVSRYQWHPFSISNFSFAKSTITFHIKDMGKNSWTNKLSQVDCSV